jgi:hypothetical protein
MSSSWVVLALVVGLASARPQRTAAQAAPKARIIGVYDAKSGALIEGAEVTDVLSGAHVVTTVTGTAALDFIVYRGDLALIEVRKIGYESVQLIVRRTDTKSITQMLDRVVVELPAVVTTEKYRIDLDEGTRAGFERRCGVAHVVCFREDSLAVRATSTIADVLKRSGLTVRCVGAGTNSGGVRSLPSCTVPGCRWFVDGFWFQPYPRQPYRTCPEREKMLGPTQVSGIEVYQSPGPVPMKYQGADCTVVVWTK